MHTEAGLQQHLLLEDFHQEAEAHSLDQYYPGEEGARTHNCTGRTYGHGHPQRMEDWEPAKEDAGAFCPLEPWSLTAMDGEKPSLSMA